MEYHLKKPGMLLAAAATVLLVAVLAAIPITSSIVTGADAVGIVIRTATVTTDNCDDPADANTGAPAGLCQANNPTQPGGSNPQVITATVQLADNGLTMVGSGTGSGFVPGRTYVSLLYLNPTVQTCARFPVGQPAQTGNIGNADNDFVSMFLGFWTVGGDGSGIFSVYAGKPSPLGNQTTGQSGLAAYNTVSVREVIGGILAGNGDDIVVNVIGSGVPVANGQDIPPNIFALRACGSLVAPAS